MAYHGLLLKVLSLSLVVALAVSFDAAAQDNSACLDCHSDMDLEAEDGRSVYTDESKLHGSVHTELECLDCHEQDGADFEDFPHFEAYQPVDCQGCHSEEGFIYMQYFYEMLRNRQTKDIPTCKECHGTHDAHRQLGMDIVCDRCHKEIAEQYKQSYHYKKYKEDPRHYPICTTCHDPHFKSKKEVMSEVEYKQEIVDICSKCHQRDVETYVHSRHYHEMESGNTKAPVCTSCHEKHSIRKPSDPESRVHARNITTICNECHPGHRESLHVDPGMDTTAVTCASCHTGHQTDMASINNQIFKEGGVFNQCNICHSSERHSKENLAHGMVMLMESNGDEANCTRCHVYHWNMPGADSVAHSAEKVECSYCHAKESRDYKKSIHGLARAQGIMEAPTCIDCHGEKDIEKTAEQFSPEGIIELCSRCHADTELMLKFQINPHVVEGFKDTYHGKLFETGTRDVKFAVCTNCHGSHTINPPEDPESSVSRTHIVETCRQCHPRANDRFVSYLVHPIKPTSEELELSEKLRTGVSDTGRLERQASGEGWQAFNSLVTKLMTLLLVGVLGAFGFHTILWFQRGVRFRVRPKETYFRRIDGFHRFLHVIVNISFLTLAFTGLPQSYAHTELAKWLFANVMSIQTAQTLHYYAALITFFYFTAHVVYLLFRIRREGFMSLMTGPNTMVFRKKDFHDFIAHMKWFVGRGPEPKFDRWTYWEKFDYSAVFWGVFVIGLSGVLRWQEEFFGSLFGGGIISLADTIHKEEALLATAFIFIVHFFNTHLRARKFPMDVSIYTGRISEKEFKEERPFEYERAVREGTLESLKIKPLGIFRTVLAYIWGTAALAVGFFLLVLIIIGQFTS